MKLQIKIIDDDNEVYLSELNLPKEVKLNAPVMAMLNPIQTVLGDEAWKITKHFNKWSL